jgi:hypothetical protein
VFKQTKFIFALVIVCLLALGGYMTAQSYGSYRDTGGGLVSNQPFCNEVTQVGGSYGCAGVIVQNAVTTTAQAAANVNTAQNLVSTVLPANLLLKAGKTLTVKGGGTYSVGAATTVAIATKLCTVSGCGSGTVVSPCLWTTGSNANTGVTSSFNFECTVQTSTIAGALSKVLGKGVAAIEVGATNATAANVFGDVTTGETAAIDLTGAIFVQTTITFGTANASNTATQQTSVMTVGSSS